VRRALGPLAVRDVMTREVVHVAPDLPLAKVVDDYFWRHHVTSFRCSTAAASWES
jgi:hypothetical protein